MPFETRSLSGLVLTLAAALILSGCVTNGTVAKAAPGHLDRYFEAACDYQHRDFDSSISRFEALKADSFQPAADVLDALDRPTIGDPVINQDSNVVKRIRKAWEDAMHVPPQTAGNDAVFQLVQALPDGLNRQVANWIIDRHRQLPPVFLFEAGRRIAAEDFEEGYFWVTLGIVRLRFEARRHDNSLQYRDLPALWGGIVAGKFREHVGVSHGEEVTRADRKRAENLSLEMYQRILGNWDELVPADLPVWPDCRWEPPGAPVSEETLAKWQAANEYVRSKYQQNVSKRIN